MPLESQLDGLTAWAGAAAGFTGGAFALIRFALVQQRSVTEQFTHYLEQALARQQEMNAGFQRSLDRLTESIQCSTLPAPSSKPALD
jgi:hypothetical protein